MLRFGLVMVVGVAPPEHTGPPHPNFSFMCMSQLHSLTTHSQCFRIHTAHDEVVPKFGLTACGMQEAEFAGKTPTN